MALFELNETLEINQSEFEKVKRWVNSNDHANLFKFISIKFNNPNLDISDKYIFYKPLEFLTTPYEHDENEYWFSFYITDKETERNSPGSIKIVVSS